MSASLQGWPIPGKNFILPIAFLRFGRYIIIQSYSFSLKALYYKTIYNIMIMGGSNDFIMNVPLSIVCSNIATMVHQSRNHHIVPIIGIQPPTEPEMARKYWSDIADYSAVNRTLMQYREWVLKFSEVFDVGVIDFYADFRRHLLQENPHDIYTDGLHLTPKGNQLMFDTISRWVEANRKLFI